jgi:hypothetical protein
LIEVPAFWDTSALVPLCVEQRASGWAKVWAQQFAMVAWWATRVEMYSAVMRLSRSGDLQRPARQIALDRVQVLAAGWREIPPSDAIRVQAAMVLDAYPLRAADGLQLAAALAWCRNRPAGRAFLCADDRLCEAAAQAGFTVLQP